MFTGLIEELGTILVVESTPDGSRITISASEVLENAKLGDSIAIDGACMTIVELADRRFSVEVSLESLSKTNFSSFKPGRRVNLERPLTPMSRIGGHYVTGHVDGLAKIVSRESNGNSQIFTFEVENPELAELMIPKGSVAILGISLTVNTVNHHRFSVTIIPHTLSHTNLDAYQPGDYVNIETDLLGKYTRKLLFELERFRPDQTELVSTFPSTLQLESGSMIDAPALVPAMNAFNRPSVPTGTNIHTGSWFNHDPE